MSKFNKLITQILVFTFIFTNVIAGYIPIFAEAASKASRDKVEILIKYKDEAKSQQTISSVKTKLKLTKLDKKKNFNKNKINVLEIASTDDINKTVTELKKNPNVEYVQPNYKINPLETSEPKFEEQWALDNTGQTIGFQKGTPGVDLNAIEAWKLTQGSPAVVVGVLDTGIDINHVDLINNTYENKGEIAGNNIDDDGNGYVDDVHGWDFANNDNSVFDSANADRHGTHVAGVIAAESNGEGIIGIAPKIKVLPLKFIDNGVGYTSDAIAAIEYAEKMGVNIINASFGGSQDNPALRDAIAKSSMLFVCAAGNNGQDTSIMPIYPASYQLPNILSVAAIDNQGNIASFSNYGDTIDVAAPGVGILSTLPQGEYGTISGTSMAAPYISGLAALLKSHISEITAEQMSARISGNATVGGYADALKTLTTAVAIDNNNQDDTTNGDKAGDIVVSTLAVTVSDKLREQIHYGENGVSPTTGNYSKSVTDMTLSAPGFAVNISRTYNSKDERTTYTMGRGWTFGFEGSFKQDTTNTSLWVAKLPNGSAQVFVKNADGSYTANDSRSILVKNADNTHTLTTNDQYTYKFNTAGYLSEMKDRNGNVVSIELDAQGKATKITDQVNRSFVVAYNATGYISSITDPMGRVVNYYYDASNRLNKVESPTNDAAYYEYDTSNFLTIVKDNSQTTIETVLYDHVAGANQHKVTEYTDSYGNKFTYAYDTTNRKTTITDSNTTPRVIEKYYDTEFYTMKSKDPEGRETIVEYYLDTNGTNIYGEEKNVIDRNGNKSIYERDSRGNITKIINPDGSIIEYQYDTKNNTIAEKNEVGNWIFYKYDENSINLILKAEPLNGTDVYTDSVDLSKFAVTRYAYYTSEYQAKGLFKQETKPAGETTTYTYDQYGNISTVTDSANNKTQSFYNINGWLTKTISPKGYVTSYNYDNDGHVVSTILNNGETTRTVYDSEGRKKQEIGPGQYDSTKDKLQNPALATDYTDTTVGNRYSYYTCGKISEARDPLGNLTQYTYDKNGNMLTETKANGTIYIYEYDMMNRLIKLSFKKNSTEAPVVLEAYSYTILSDGKQKKVQTKYLNTTETAVTIYIYNYAERVIEQHNPEGGIEYTKYNEDGTIASETDGNGNTIFYIYDGLNRLTGTWTQIEPSKYSYAGYVYDKSGKKLEERFGRDIVGAHELQDVDRMSRKIYSYYADGKLKMMTDTAGGKTTYEYDKDGYITHQNTYTTNDNSNVTEYINNHLGKPVTQKVYIKAGDIAGNLLEDNSIKTLVTSYEYDKEGNISKISTPDGNCITYTYDKMNRQLSQSQLGQDENGSQVTITSHTTYDWQGQPLTTVDAKGHTTTYVYDERGFLLQGKTTVTVNDGTTTTADSITAYAYDLAGRKIAIVSPKNFVQDAQGSYNINELNRTEYVYDKEDHVVIEKETYNTTAWCTLVTKAYKYDKNGNVIKELDGEGFKAGTGTADSEKIETGYGTEYRYNGQNQVTVELDPISKDSGMYYGKKYEYDGMGQKTIEINAKGSVTGYYYDDQGNVTRQVAKPSLSDPEQVLKTNVYDLAGNLISQTDGVGNTITYEYNAFEKVSIAVYPGDETTQAENTIIYQYDIMGNLAKTEDSFGTINAYTHDKQGRQLSNTTKGKDSNKAITTTVQYDINGNKRYETDGNGNTKEYVYDELNRLIENRITTTNINAEKIVHTTKNIYDLNNNQVKQIDWRGNVFESIYDPLNRLIEKKDPYATIQKLEYNANHAQIKSYDSKNKATIFGYDKLNRLIYTADSLGHSTKQSYDSIGNIELKIDGLNNTTRYTYDFLNRLSTVTNPKGEVTSYTYDLNGNKLTQKDGKGNFTTYEYNPAQKLINRIDHGGRTWATNKYTYVDGKVESYTYYQNGLLKTKLDRNGVTTNYSYDSFGRMLSQEAGAQKISYTYDNNGNQITMTDATGQTVRTYDELNRVVTKTVPQFGTTVFQYDIQLGIAEGYAEDGYVGEKSIDSKGNETLKITDKVGRLKSVKADSETTGTVYQYDGNGNRTSVTYENGAKEVYTYYDDNLLATLTNYGTTGNIIESYQYTYDAAHNQKTKVDAKGTTSYTYDTLNRLIKVLEPIGLGGKLTEYGYDKAGNRLTERIINGSQTTLTMYAYDERNRLLTTTLQTPTGSKEISKYVYDNNGNTLQKTKETTKKADPLEKPSFSMFIIGQTDNEFSRSMVINEYDLFNQIVTTKTGAQIANYIYNGEGRRVQKNVNGQATNYLYEYDKVVLETDGKGKQTARNVYGINLLSRTIDNQKVNYLYNGHADVTALIDATGTKVASYYYDAFGNPLETTGTISNPIRYAGYQYDTETGLYYLNARYYDSKIARFLTEDTFRGQDNDPLSLNRYTYCHNEPVMYSNPTGHRAETLGSKTRNDNAVFKYKKQVKANYVKATKVVKTVVNKVIKPVVNTVVKPIIKTVVKPVVKTVVNTVVNTAVKPVAIIKPAPNTPKPGNISKNTEDSGRNTKNINNNQGMENGGTSLWSDVKGFFKEIFSPAKTEEGQVAFALALSSAYSRQIDMDMADFQAESSSIYEEDDIDIESPITIKGNKLVNSNITSDETVSTGANNVANGVKLNAQLTFEEANSVFTKSGSLKSEVVVNSSKIDLTGGIKDSKVIQELTKNGSIINQWSKMTTQSFKSPNANGPFQVHFYQNQVTGEISNYGMKSVFNIR